jgi:glycosyltransferase involved in cell wall biosynthesis
MWDRGRFHSHLEAGGCEVKKMRLSVPPDSIKVALYLPIWWFFVIFQLLAEKWDVVHAADFETFVPALIVAKIKRKPIIYDIFDFYADMIGFPILPKISRKIAAKIDRFFMKFANFIIIPDGSRREQIGKKLIKHAVIIINSPNENILNEVVIEKEQKNKKFTVFFGGVVAESRCIDKVCLAVKDLHDVGLIIAGPCPEYYKKKLQNICRNMKNVKLFLKWIPYEEIIRQTINADLLFALYDPIIPNNKYASPNKLFEAMMCGKPIIVSDDTSMTDIVRKENCGLVVPYGDVNAIKEVIIKLRTNPNLCKQLGKNGRKAYEEKYNWGIMEKRLINTYKKIERETQVGRDVS